MDPSNHVHRKISSTHEQTTEDGKTYGRAGLCDRTSGGGSSWHIATEEVADQCSYDLDVLASRRRPQEVQISST